MTIEGKTKIIENVYDENLVRIRTKDSLTGNDAAIKADLPVARDKTTQTCCVFYLLKKNNVPVSYISRNDETSFIAKKCEMIPVECVMRRRPFGSYLKREPQKLSSEIFDPLLTEFFHKNSVVNGEMMTEDRARELYLKDGKWTDGVYTDPLIEPHDDTWLLYPPKEPRHQMQPLMDILPVVDNETLEYIKNNLMIPCFEIIEKAWKKFNVDLVDMKIEVGYQTEDKKLVIADVIDNDSWRIWPNGDPKQQLDKQSFRDGESLTEVQEKYRIVTEYTKDF
jgi:phosphoribosylaminoimidazole-succinocarboxamide synthase|tara:strand:+ start:60 stop:899 length:840 start_codon:yes stop_codon:yes gene_type:complete